jgi:hypothetical protein
MRRRAVFPLPYDGVTLNLNFGKTANPHLRVLFDYDEWWHPASSAAGVTGPDFDKITENFTASAQYFPWTMRRGFFLEGGLGLTVAKVWVSDTSGLRRHGLGLTVGAGYDLFPGRSVSPTPRFAFSYGSIGRIYYPLGTHNLWADGWKHEILSLGLALTFHRHTHHVDPHVTPAKVAPVQPPIPPNDREYLAVRQRQFDGARDHRGERSSARPVLTDADAIVASL